MKQSFKFNYLLAPMNKTFFKFLFISVFYTHALKAMPNKNTDHPFYPLEEETIPHTTLNVTPITDEYELGKQIANSIINTPN